MLQFKRGRRPGIERSWPLVDVEVHVKKEHFLSLFQNNPLSLSLLSKTHSRADPATAPRRANSEVLS